MDLSYPQSKSVNDGIPKGQYLGEEFILVYPSVDELMKLIKIAGPGCMLYKRDLKHAYRQIPIDTRDLHFPGFC